MARFNWLVFESIEANQLKYQSEVTSKKVIPIENENLSKLRSELVINEKAVDVPSEEKCEIPSDVIQSSSNQRPSLERNHAVEEDEVEHQDEVDSNEGDTPKNHFMMSCVKP